MTDFLDEVLASHCLANGDPCKVDELKWVLSLLLKECEFIVGLCQCIEYVVWTEVSHTINDGVNWNFGSHMVSCQSEHAPLCFILFAGLLK